MSLSFQDTFQNKRPAWCKQLQVWTVVKEKNDVLITAARLTTWLLHINRCAFHKQQPDCFFFWVLRLWHYRIGFRKEGWSSVWAADTKSHQTSDRETRSSFTSQRQHRSSDVRAQQTGICYGDLLCSLPNQKQNWKLSFVFCLRVVIWLGIITWLSRSLAISSSYTRLLLLSILFTFT